MHGMPEEKWKKSKRLMDAKKLAGFLVALLIAAALIANANPGILGVVDIGLIGLLCIIRRRRSLNPRTTAFAHISIRSRSRQIS
jgi:hypothetical protein